MAVFNHTESTPGTQKHRHKAESAVPKGTFPGSFITGTDFYLANLTLKKVHMFSLIAKNMLTVKRVGSGKYLKSADLREAHLAGNTIIFSTTKINDIYLN